MSDGPSKRSNSKSKGKSSKSFDGKYIRYELSVEDKRVLAGREFDTDRVFDQLDALVGAGYKFSVGLQSDGSAYLASLYDRDTESPFAGYTLTGRGRSFTNAIAALLFKHFDIFDGQWPGQSTSDDEWG